MLWAEEYRANHPRPPDHQKGDLATVLLSEAELLFS